MKEAVYREPTLKKGLHQKNQAGTVPVAIQQNPGYKSLNASPGYIDMPAVCSFGLWMLNATAMIANEGAALGNQCPGFSPSMSPDSLISFKSFIRIPSFVERNARAKPLKNKTAEDIPIKAENSNPNGFVHQSGSGDITRISIIPNAAAIRIAPPFSFTFSSF
jgi:hypothetical protein